MGRNPRKTRQKHYVASSEPSHTIVGEVQAETKAHCSGKIFLCLQGDPVGKFKLPDCV